MKGAVGRSSAPTVATLEHSGKCRLKFGYALQQRMKVAAPIFTKLMLDLQLCVKNAYAECHENPTNELVYKSQADNEQTVGSGLHIRRSFLLRKERP
jgi:hypothetical protein